MHSEPIHLVIAINQKYIQYAYVMLTSLLLHTSCDVHVYVLHRELNAADQQTFDTLTHSYPVTFHFIHVPDALLPPQKFLQQVPGAQRLISGSQSRILCHPALTVRYISIPI